MAERPPLVIVEGGDDDFDEQIAIARMAGWRLRPGWAPVEGPAPAGVVYFGPVTDDRSAALAAMAAARGGGVLILARGSPGVIGTLFEDLRRIGRVDYRTIRPTLETSRAGLLDADQRRLLASLAEGLPVSEAARRVPCSRRTAQRKLADARRLLNVATNSEAVLLLGREQPLG